MKRRSTASEQRLKDKYTNGIGGHIRQEDIENTTLFQWAQREFAEEVCYQGNFTVKPIGLINDERDEVGRVHIGFVFLLEGDSDQIAIRAEHKEGYLLSLEECKELYPLMESWSQFVLDYLVVIE
jgi:predicted NUDIX family phosphoesterase